MGTAPMFSLALLSSVSIKMFEMASFFSSLFKKNFCFCGMLEVGKKGQFKEVNQSDEIKLR